MKTILIFFLIFSSFAYAAKPASHQKIMDYVFFNLPETGVIKQDRFGFVYVDIDNNYILKLLDFIKEDGFEKPPYFYGATGHGAHISVITENEAKNKGIRIKEDGQSIYFKVTDCQIIDSFRNDLESVCVLTVESPILDKLRAKYGLPPKKADYHITIGFKPKAAKAA